MARGNTEKYIGVLLNGGMLDKQTRDFMKKLIYKTAGKVRDKKGPRYTKLDLSKALGIDRNRLNRLMVALEIVELF